MRLWKTARNQEQLQEWMAKPLGDNADGLLAYYQFNELNGSDLPDTSDNEFHGTLKNMTDTNWAPGAGEAFTSVGPKGQLTPGTFSIEDAEIESTEAQVTINGIHDAGNNEIAANTVVAVMVEQEGSPVEPPVVKLSKRDGVLIIGTTNGTLQSASSVTGP